MARSTELLPELRPEPRPELRPELLPKLLTELLVDVDRWDRAAAAEQDAAIAEVAKRLDGFEWVTTQEFRGVQRRPSVEQCPSCHGMGGSPAQSGNSDSPDCDRCENEHEVTIYADAGVETRHRAGVFRHRRTGTEFVLVPGRMEIAACLVARDPGSLHLIDDDLHSAAPALRRLTRSETRHIVMRAGAFDAAWDDGVWNEHPFGLRTTDEASLIVSEERVHWGRRPMRHPDRLAATIPDCEAAQAAAYHALADELGPLDKVPLPPGCLARTGCGTADPPRDRPLALAFSRDGRWLATAPTSGRDIHLWDVEKGRPLSRLRLSCEDGTQRINSLAFSPDDTRIVVATNLDIEIFELTGQSLARLGKGLPSSRIDGESTSMFPQRIVHWLPNGYLLSAEVSRETKDVSLTLIHPDTGEQRRSADWKLEGSFWGIDMGTCGLHAAVSILMTGALAIWDIERWEVIRRIPMEDAYISHLVIGGDLLLVSRGRELRAHRISNGESFQLAKSLSSGFPEVAASPDGSRVAWSHVGGVGVVNVATGKIDLCGHDVSTTPIAFSADGRLCATSTSHGKSFAAIWPVK